MVCPLFLREDTNMPKKNTSVSVTFTPDEMKLIETAMEERNRVTPLHNRRTKTEVVRILTVNWAKDTESDVRLSEKQEPGSEGHRVVRPFVGDVPQWRSL